MRHPDVASPHGKSRVRMSGGRKGSNGELVGMNKVVHCCCPHSVSKWFPPPLKQTPRSLAKMPRLGQSPGHTPSSGIKNWPLCPTCVDTSSD